MWRAVFAVALMIGCNEQRPPDKPATPPQPTAPGSAAVAVVADAAVLVDAAAPADAAVAPDARVAGKVERKGEGSCKADADCELSSWQEGCCTASCAGYAISKQLLAKRVAKENCPPRGTNVCPPPSPCPLPDFLPEQAVCRKGTCTALGSAVAK